MRMKKYRKRAISRLRAAACLCLAKLKQQQT
jgi:hypothetical protein